MARTMKQRRPILADAYGTWPVPPLFAALRKHALRERFIYVRFMVGEHDATFITEYAQGRDPSIAVYTPERIGHIDAAHAEEHVILLARELGRHEAWLREELGDSPNQDERAWKYGREILKAAVPAFTAWDAFDAKANATA